MHIMCSAVMFASYSNVHNFEQDSWSVDQDVEV